MMKGQEGKLKLRDRRMLKLKVEKRKTSSKELSASKDISRPNKPTTKGISTPTKNSFKREKDNTKFFQARINDNRIKSPMMIRNAIQSRQNKGSNLPSRAQSRNITIETKGVGFRSPSPHIMSPILKTRKYENKNSNNVTNEYHNNQFDQNNSEFLNEVVNLIKSKPQYFLDGSSKLPNYKQIGSPTISNNTSNGVFDFYPASIKPRLASPNQNRRVLPIQNLEAGFMKNPVPNLRQRKIRPKLDSTKVMNRLKNKNIQIKSPSTIMTTQFKAFDEKVDNEETFHQFEDYSKNDDRFKSIVKSRYDESETDIPPSAENSKFNYKFKSYMNESEDDESITSHDDETVKRDKEDTIIQEFLDTKRKNKDEANELSPAVKKDQEKKNLLLDDMFKNSGVFGKRNK